MELSFLDIIGSTFLPCGDQWLPTYSQFSCEVQRVSPQEPCSTPACDWGLLLGWGIFMKNWLPLSAILSVSERSATLFWENPGEVTPLCGSSVLEQLEQKLIFLRGPRPFLCHLSLLLVLKADIFILINPDLSFSGALTLSYIFIKLFNEWKDDENKCKRYLFNLIHPFIY